MLPDGWDNRTIESVLSRIIDYRGKAPPKSSTGVRLITARNIRFGFLDLSHEEFIDASKYDEWMNRGRPNASDILFTTEAPMGYACMYPREGIYAVGQRAITLQAKSSELDSRYLLHFLLSPQGQYEIYRRSSGSTATGIKSKEFRKILVPLPPLHEQHRIADILSTWDRAIETVEKLIKNTETQMTGLAGELLTGQRRLPGFGDDWTTQKLGQIGRFRKGKGISRDQAEVEGVPAIRYGEIYTHHDIVVREFYTFIDKRVASQSERVFPGELLFAISGETPEEIGKCVTFTYEHEVYAGGDIIVFNPNSQDSIYLSYVLNSPQCVRQKIRFGQGKSVVHINAKNLADLVVKLPPHDEQVAIRTVLEKLQVIAEKANTRLKQLQNEKRALMQQLLTGKRRVKVEEIAA